ncbi:MAG: sulfatase-like hydrolase/transferase, partial [Thermoanaerobaculia bacterium]
YHLNALEEPENVDYPKSPEFFAKFGPRDIIHSVATDTFDNTDQPRWGVVGKQKIDSRGQLTKKRMETFDDETLKDSMDFIDRAAKAGKPFFVWHNSTRMHVNTHLRPKYQDMVAEKGFAGATITEFDDGIGALLKQLDDLGIADNTIVIVSTDNGAEKFSWPDGGTSPFRGEKATTYEGGFRVPAVIRWPGVVEPGTLINDIFHHMDWIPTFMSYLGEPDIAEKLKKGYQAAGKTFKVHLDGYDQLALLKGEGPGARKEIHYITDDGDYSAVRYGKWKIQFTQQPARGSMEVWNKTFATNRGPYVTDLRADPFEEASDREALPMYYDKWHFQRSYVMVPAAAYVGQFLKTFDEFPPRSKPASFSIGDALASIQTASQGQ